MHIHEVVDKANLIIFCQRMNRNDEQLIQRTVLFFSLVKPNEIIVFVLNQIPSSMLSYSASDRRIARCHVFLPNLLTPGTLFRPSVRGASGRCEGSFGGRLSQTQSISHLHEIHYDEPGLVSVRGSYYS